MTDGARRRQRIVEADKRFVWHPYTPMRQYIDNASPLVIERAEGARLYDVDGRSYLDGNSSWWTAALGHSHPRLLAALHKQAEQMTHVALGGVVHENAALLAEELVSVAPAGLERVFFSDDGSTSVEVALKLALQFFSQNGARQRTRFIALSSAFHGETLGVTGLGGVEVFRKPFADVLMDVVHVPPEGDGAERAFLALQTLLERDGDRIAALVVEPLVQGAGGMRIYDAELLREARELTRKRGVLLVFDEVFTGYGRTGTMWAAERAGVSPDMLCTAKGFTAGILPMAATLVSEELFRGFLGSPERAFYYGHTYCGHALGAAVAREVLQVFRDENVIETSRPKARRIAETFERLGKLPGVERARSLGMIGALDLGTEGVLDVENDGGYLQESGWRVYEEALTRGAYLRPLGNVVYTCPPLNIDDADLDELLATIEASVTAVVAM